MDEILIEIETDKVVLEVPAPAAGTLAEIVQGDGATVAAEQVIARIDTEGKAAAAAPAAPSGRASTRPCVRISPAPPATTSSAALIAKTRQSSGSRDRRIDGRIVP